MHIGLQKTREAYNIFTKQFYLTMKVKEEMKRAKKLFLHYVELSW